MKADRVTRLEGVAGVDHRRLATIVEPKYLGVAILGGTNREPRFVCIIEDQSLIAVIVLGD